MSGKSHPLHPPSRGKTGKALGKGFGYLQKRHQGRLNPAALYRIPKPVLRKMQRRAGIPRVNTLMYETLRERIDAILADVLRDAVIASNYLGSRTIRHEHVAYALGRRNIHLLGIADSAS